MSCSVYILKSNYLIHLIYSPALQKNTSQTPKSIIQGYWDTIICYPPCTHITHNVRIVAIVTGSPISIPQPSAILSLVLIPPPRLVSTTIGVAADVAEGVVVIVWLVEFKVEKVEEVRTEEVVAVELDGEEVDDDACVDGPTVPRTVVIDAKLNSYVALPPRVHGQLLPWYSGQHIRSELVHGVNPLGGVVPTNPC